MKRTPRDRKAPRRLIEEDELPGPGQSKAAKSLRPNKAGNSNSSGALMFAIDGPSGSKATPSNTKEMPRKSTRIQTVKRFYDDPIIHEDKTEKIPKFKKSSQKKKQIICGDCGYLPKRVQALTAHRNAIHLNLKLFKCQIDGCDESFSFKSSLQRHVRIVHDNLKSFICQPCDLRFSTQAQLNGHTARIHFKICHPCTECQKSYSDKSNLKRHVGNKHEN